MTVGANVEIDPSVRLANLEQAVFGGPNPAGAFPLVSGQLGIEPILYSYYNSAFPFGSFNSAITIIPSASVVNGLYQMQLYAVITTTITGASSWSFKMNFTDDNTAQNPQLSTSNTLTAGTIQQAIYTFEANSGAAITWTPTAASITAGVVSLRAVLTRLQ